MARIIVLISAAKRVGKTHLSVNLALHLAQLGRPTCLFNADPDPSTVCSLLGIYPRHSLRDLISNRVRIENVYVKTGYGINFFPGCPGIEQMGSLDRGSRNRLHRAFTDLNRYDFFIVDTFSGLSRSVAALCKASPEVVLVMAPDARSLTRAYLLLRALGANHYDGSVMLLINMSRDLKVARKSYHRFKEAAVRYLPVPTVPLGTVFYDSRVEQADRECYPFISRFPDSDASKCIVNIARHLCEKKTEDLAVSAFWGRFLENLRHPFQIPGKPRHPAEQQASHRTKERTEPAAAALEQSRFAEKALDALERLERQMASLSTEVSGMKKTWQSGVAIPKAGVGSETVTENPAPQQPEKLILDFETFLAQRKKGAA